MDARPPSTSSAGRPQATRDVPAADGPPFAGATGHPRIRTFHARHGRTTDGMRRLLDEVGPRFTPDGRDADRPLVLEVGCGHGQAALAWADAHPHADLLAVDVHVPGIAHLLEALEHRPRPNLFVARADALDLLDHDLGPASLAGVLVLFPDPWPKARHHKRRFVRDDVLDLLADRLAPGAEVAFATDVADYAATARVRFDAHPAFEGGPVARPTWRPVTPYEQRGLDAGRHPVDLGYRRR